MPPWKRCSHSWPEGMVEVRDAGFSRRADRVCGAGQWRAPGARVSWAREVTRALEDLAQGRVTQQSDASWFVDNDGRRLPPRR